MVVGNFYTDLGSSDYRLSADATSVTLTLHPQFAAGLSSEHDPLGIVGLARVMGPAFRARFQVAFDEALAKANSAVVNEGDIK